jgi:hypothetical protein
MHALQSASPIACAPLGQRPFARPRTLGVALAVTALVLAGVAACDPTPTAIVSITTASSPARLVSAPAAGTHGDAIGLSGEGWSVGPANTNSPAPSSADAAIVRASLSRFQRCYELFLRDSPEYSGTVTIAWTILPDGHPTNITATFETPRLRGMQTCLEDVVRALVFPPRVTATPMRFPLHFESH